MAQPIGMDRAAAAIAKTGAVDMLDGGGGAQPKPSLANGVPTIYTSQVPAELIVFKGQPDFVPIAGTQLLWAANTTSDVLIDTANNDYYVLMAGRWFRAAGLTGPWSFVPSNALPADFARIPPQAPAGAVLPTVAGTPQAQEAVISNSIPQTATVPLKNGPTFTPSFDGPPQFAPIAGTSLSYVVNASEPLIQVAPDAYYAVVAGVWFTAAQPTGPWRIATSVPSVVYTIPPSSSLYYVTYVKIYEATPQFRLRGLHARLHGHRRLAVRHRGLRHRLCLPTVDRLGLVPGALHLWRLCRAGLQPLGRLQLWLRHGPGHRRVDGPVLGLGRRRLVRPRLLGPLPVLRLGQRQRLRPLGQRGVLGHAQLVRGRRRGRVDFRGSYATARGTTGNIAAGRQYNAWTGNATRGYDRTFNTAAGASGNVARGANTNVYTGQRSTGSAVSATGPGGSSYDRAGATTAGPLGAAHAGGGSFTNGFTGKTTSWSSASLGNNHVADVNGNVYRNSGSGWQQHSAGGWGSASGDTSWADRESQARSAGDDRFGGFASRLGGGGLFGGGGRFGGDGFGGGDRFGGGGFGGGGFGGRFGGGGFGGGFRR